MKRLLLFSSEFPPGPGGIGTHAYQFAQHMQSWGWEVHILTLQDYVSAEEAESFNRAEDFQITPLSHARTCIGDILNRWNLLQNLIKNWRPDLLVVTGDRQVWVAAALQWVTRSYSPPWCAVWHGVIPPRPVSKQITRWSFSQPDLTITVSQYSLMQMLGMGIRPRRSLVITNGADENRFYPDSRAGLDLRTKLGLGDAQILLTVGHVANRKGQDVVIRALPEILRAVPNAQYLLAGLPTRQAALEKLAVELGVSEHVHFLGRISAEMLHAAYNACDVFVLVSRHSHDGDFEGYGIAAAEAALCAKPSVVAGNSGLAEAVQDEWTGFVVPENDPQATAQTIQKLLQDSTLRQRMGEQARQHALVEQTWSVCMRQYYEALSQLVAEHRDRIL